LEFAFVSERVAESMEVDRTRRGRSGRRRRPGDVFESRVIRTKEDNIGRRVDRDERRSLRVRVLESESRFANEEDSAEREDAIEIRSSDDVREREVTNLADLTEQTRREQTTRMKSSVERRTHARPFVSSRANRTLAAPPTKEEGSVIELDALNKCTYKAGRRFDR